MTTVSPSSSSAERPREKRDIPRWIKQNLFSSWFNSILTVLALLLIGYLGQVLVSWVLFEANWQVVEENLRLLMVGTFPSGQVWRVWLCVTLAAALIGLSWGVWPDIMGRISLVYGVVLLLLALFPLALTNRIWLLVSGGLIFGGWQVGRYLTRGDDSGRWSRWIGTGWVALLPLVLVLLVGLPPILPLVDVDAWGGVLLTFVLAITAILFSFPLGVLLAIGRRSSLPAVSSLCTIYIELFRGVPLVTVLFMFLIMLPFFVPGGENTPNVIRAIVGFTMFTAAYIAENVRGGLQAIPKGQSEAARAMGLNPMLTMAFIILPQALRIVIPANVNQFVSLFKDTSLVIVVGGGMRELLGRARNIPNQDAFLGQWLEPLVFAALFYWVFCFSMTYVSRRLEEKLNVGYR